MRRDGVLKIGGVATAALLPVLAGCPGDHEEYEDLCADVPGTLCTVAGTTELGFGGDGEDARGATFYRPTDVAAIPGSTAFMVVDFNNHKVRRVNEDWTIETVIGTVLPGDGASDQSDRTEPGAPGTEIGLNHPVQVEYGPDGRLYLPNWHNHKVRIWDPATGLAYVSVANTDPLSDGNGANAGFAGDGGPAADALLAFPNSIAFGPDGEYYILDQKNARIRRVGTDDVISTVAGDGQYESYGDGGPALSAAFKFVDSPTNIQPEQGAALEVDDAGNIYVTDTYNHCVRMIEAATGVVTTIAGSNGTSGFSGDGGMAADALLNTPKDVELGPDGRLYVADTNNHVVRAIDLAAGTIETVAGTGQMGLSEDGLLATESSLNRPFGIDFDANGALLIADYDNSRVARVTP